MIIDLTDEERTFLGFHLACRLEDYEKVTRKHPAAMEQWRRLEELIYTKVIPESFKGPKPSYWKGV